MIELPFTYFAAVSDEIEPPVDGTRSRTLYQDDCLQVELLAFAAGQEVSEHTASTPAILHFLRGKAQVTLGAGAISAEAGTWIHMAAQLPHSILAKTPVVLLLLLLKEPSRA